MGGNPIAVYVVEATVLMIGLFWVVSNANNFNLIATASQTSLVGAFRQLAPQLS